jgi:Protein of unknown function (DUF2750)
MSNDPSEDYLEKFVERVKATRQVWGLSSPADGWAYCTSDIDGDRDVILFWSEESLAAQHQQDEWEDHVPTMVDLDTFIDHWLQGMDADGVLVGPNWDVELSGPELTAKELADHLLDEEE